MSNNILRVEDFTIEVLHLPQNVSPRDMKPLLWDHFSRFGTVFGIELGLSDYSRIENLIQIYKETKKLILLEARMLKS